MRVRSVRQRNEGASLRGGALSLAAATLLVPAGAWAIPSPDVIVNVFASAGQVLGVLSVGAGAALAKGRRRGGASGGVSSSWLLVLAGVLAVSLAGNVLIYAWHADQVTRRLEANLVRPSTEEGKKVGDISLKSLSFSDQLEHPSALHTEKLADLLAAGNIAEQYHFIDVRNPEEVEMGRILGVTPIPQPDLRLRLPEFQGDGKPIILLCDSGNRSGELCGDFAAAGSECRFLVGGFEKWVAEGREVVQRLEGAGDGIRDVAPYRNKHVLLDTAEVEALVQQEDAIFVDVRYPGDFELGHLPKAVNVPLRKLPTGEMWETLRALPDKPVIAPCYDKRSCFYAMILGLRLDRIGRDFRGRYTVPHEYFVKKPEQEWVLKWRAENERTLFNALRAPLAALLTALHGWIGSFALAITAFVLLLRFVFAPTAYKGERDQAVTRAFAAELAAVRAAAKGDAVREARAVREWNTERRMTPWLNLLGSLVQLGVFLLCFKVVERVGGGVEGRFLWLESASALDSTYVLPVLNGALMFAFVAGTARRKGVLAWCMRVLLGVFIGWLMLQLGAAVNFYLACSLLFVTVQTLFTRALLAKRFDRSETPADTSGAEAGIFPLAMAHRVSGAGAKAARLGKMLEAELPVPDGFVITERLFTRNNMQDETDELRLSQKDAARLVELRSRMSSRNVAVRSSGLNEDGAEQSYAGVFESIVNVKPYEFGAAVQDVRSSLSSRRVKAYSGNDRERGGILVQEMVDAEFAGVLFTEHPAESGSMLVELVRGLGDALVSGDTNSEAYRFGRKSLIPLDGKEPPIDLQPLLDLGVRVERLFKAPQDIEWAFAGGRFLVLQARNITRTSRRGASPDAPRALLEQERAKLLDIVSGSKPHDVALRQTELSELLPRPTPLSLSFMELLWAPGGSADLACRALGVPYEVSERSAPLCVSAFGALYQNQRELLRRTARGPGAAAAFRLSRAADELRRSFEQEFLPGHMKLTRERAAVSFDGFPLGELVQLFGEWVDDFVTRTYVHAEKVNVAADFYFKAARRELERRGLPAAEILSAIPMNISYHAFSLLPRIQSGERPLSEFLELYGHRAVYDYELSEPRFAEQPELVLELAASHSRNGHHAAAVPGAELTPYQRALADRACAFQGLKEDAKHYALLALAQIRRLARAIGARLGAGDDVFFLTVEELRAITPESPEWEHVVRRRKAAHALFAAVRLPSQLTLAAIERLVITDSTVTPGAESVDQGPVSSDGLRGVMVAGSRTVEGIARIVVDEEQMGFFRPGEVLVTRFTNPKWTPLFSQASGIVTEIGGWLSHAAILAREYNVPTIVGAGGAVDGIRTGDRLRLHADGTIELVSRAGASAAGASAAGEGAQP